MVYVFDSWLRKIREALKPLGVRVCMQYHDELLLVCKEPLKIDVETILKESMKAMNLEMKLNVDIGIDTQFGKNYAECH